MRDAAGSLFLLVVLAAPILATIALIGAHRQGRAHATDYAALSVPAVLFFVIGNQRGELHEGWALIFWPAMIAVSSMYLFAVKVFVFDRYAMRSDRTSIVLLGILGFVSLALAVSVAPLLE